MRITHAVGLIIMLCLCALISPSNARGADWSFSPYAAQIADGGSGQQPSDSTAAPAPSQYHKKAIGKAVMFSLIIPGAGQIYAEAPWWRVLPWFAIEAVGWYVFAKNHSDGTTQTTNFENYAGKRPDWTDLDHYVPDGHFNPTAYLHREYQVAINQQYVLTPFQGTFQQWLDQDGTRGMHWTDPNEALARSSYLPAPYGHDIMTSDEQQYYEMIGKYIDQFGYGWRDTYDNAIESSADWMTTGDPGAIWTDATHLGDTTYVPLYYDDLARVWGDSTHTWQMWAVEKTLAFDGRTPYFFKYRDMRGEANNSLSLGNVGMEVVLVNHIVSALEAAFEVRYYNKKHRPSPLSNIQLRYEAVSRDGDIARMMKVSFPLN